MKARTGRPPRKATGTHSTLTIRIPAADKNLLIQMADGYDMSITEYLLTLLRKDASTAETI